MASTVQALAGVHDATGSSTPAAWSKGVARAAEAGFGDVWVDGPLAVAAPAGPAAAGSHVAFVDGEVEGRDDPARALLEAGADGLEPIRGAFALLLWDREARAGMLARDHLGDRNLFVLKRDGKTFFASEVRALLALLPTRPAPDPRAVAHWLATGSVPGDRTLFEGVRRIPPGSMLRLGAGGNGRERFWAPRYREPVSASPQDLAEGLRHALGTAIRRRVRDTDLPGIMLSGGLDSSCVAGIASHVLGEDRRPRAYSAVFPSHPDIDESELIAELTASLGLPATWNRVQIGSAFPSALEFLSQWQLPLLGPGHLFEQPLIERAASEGVTLMLDGQGGDELFGPAPYLIADRVCHGRLGAAFRLARRFPTVGESPPDAQIRALVREYGGKGALPYWVHRAHRRYAGYGPMVPAWLTPQSIDHFGQIDDNWVWKRESGPRWWTHLVTRLTDLRERFGLPDYVRQRSAAAGLRGRSPLFDVDLVELMLSVPPELAFDPILGRPLARQSLRGLLPDRVRLRQGKADFSAFYHQSLAGEGFEPIHRLLSANSAEVHAFADRDSVRSMLERPPGVDTPGWRNWAPAVWRLASIEVWLRMQSDPNLPVRLLDGPLRRSSYQITRAP